MGRRNRRNRHQGEDGDYDEEDADSFEREWLRKRQKTAAHDDGSAAPAPAPAPASAPAAKQPPEESTNVADKATDGGDSKIDKLRAKKQAQKQRRKEKKAAAAAKRKEQEATVAEQQAQRNKDRAAKELKQKQKQQEKNNPQQQHAFQTLRKGVQMRDLKVGKGPMVQHRKKCRVRYVLRSKSHISGKILDSSQNFAFRLGKGEVIPGWDIGMEAMKVGGVRRLIVPPQAGYGNKDIGAGRGAMLFFEIELLHVAP